jgi:hypothetical protein
MFEDDLKPSWGRRMKLGVDMELIRVKIGEVNF